jgi:heme exporter protein CcmD
MSTPHIGFIVAAYVLTLVVVLAMIIGVLVDNYTLRKSLSSLEAKSPNEDP